MCNRLVFPNAKLPQVGDPGPRATPLLPVATPDAASDPLVQFAEAAFDRHQAEVAHPALEVPAKLFMATGHRHAAVAARDGSHAVLELAHALGASRESGRRSLGRRSRGIRPRPYYRRGSSGD